jgi:alpha-amylase
MMWALPPERQLAVEADQRWLEAQGKPELARLVAAGTWREFLARYPEARRAHRRVTAVSSRIERMRLSDSARTQREEARREIHRAQCNCSYWHGVFGGFYLPHLRQSVHEHWLRAESLADAAEGRSEGWIVERAEEETLIRSPRIAIAVSMEEGGSITEIADRRRPFDFAGVIARRREAYHAKVAAAVETGRVAAEREPGSTPETIHAGIQLKDPGLKALLRYDGRPRSASQEWMLAESEIAAAGGLRAAIGSGPVGLRFSEASPGSAPADQRVGDDTPTVRLVAAGPEQAKLSKEIAPGPEDAEFQVRFAGISGGFWLASEWNLSLLTGDAPGRRLALRVGGSSRVFAPGSQGEAESVGSLRLEDSEFLKVALTLDFEPEARLEWAPVETVSLSESGVERVYQGTSFLIGWRPTPEGRARIRARVEEVTAAS